MVLSKFLFDNNHHCLLGKPRILQLHFPPTKKWCLGCDTKMHLMVKLQI